MAAGIESGLIQMLKHAPGEEFTCGWLEKIDKTTEIPKFSQEDIEAMVLAGIIKDLE